MTARPTGRPSLAFLGFVKANLRGQTGLRVDASWATQASVLQGMARFVPPDLVLREEEIAGALPALAAMVGCAGAPAPVAGPARSPVCAPRDPRCRDRGAGREIYQRDYLLFGYGPWAERG